MGDPQASNALALPKALAIVALDGLHPSVGMTPDIEITGGVLSTVHVTTEVAVAVFPHASVAVNVLVCVLVHPFS